MAPQSVQLQFYCEGRVPFGLTLTLPRSYETKPARRLLHQFFKAYREAHPADAEGLSEDAFVLVDVASRRALAETALVNDVGDGAVLSVAPRAPERGPALGVDEQTAKAAIDRSKTNRVTPNSSSPKPTFHELSSVDPDGEGDEFEAYCLYMYERTCQTNRTMRYARVRTRLRAALRRRVAGPVPVVDDASSNADSSDVADDRNFEDGARPGRASPSRCAVRSWTVPSTFLATTFERRGLDRARPRRGRRTTRLLR